MLDRQRLLRLNLADDPVDLDSIESAPDAQHSGQHDDGIAVRHQKITRRNITVRDEQGDRVKKCVTTG